MTDETQDEEAPVTETDADAGNDAAAGVDPAPLGAPGEAGEDDASRSAFMGVPIEVTIAVGKARPLVSDLVKLRRDSVISLDSKIDDPVELYIGDKLIARGELQEMEESEGQLGVRLTEVSDIPKGV